MFYIERDGKGEIIAIRKDAKGPGMEKKKLDDEIMNFLSSKEEVGKNLLNELAATDLQIIRILEDLVDLLVKKNVIMFTELPEMAQLHLQRRQKMRKLIENESFIVDDIL